MEDLVESLARGNVTEVKVLLASVALALAVYQLVLIAVGYGKVRPPFLDAAVPAPSGHLRVRAAGGRLADLRRGVPGRWLSPKRAPTPFR